MQIFKGKSLNTGVCKGTVFVYKNQQGLIRKETVLDIDGELLRFQTACLQAKELLKALYHKTKESVGQDVADIFAAQEMFLEDESLISEIEDIICGEKVSAEFATFIVTEQKKAELLAIHDEMIRSKADDLSEVAGHILHILKDDKEQVGFEKGPHIVVANSLAVSDLLKMDKEKVTGLVLTRGSVYSHVAILAKSMHLPTLIQTELESDQALHGKAAVLDATEGNFIVDPDEECLAYIAERIKQEAREEMELRKLVNKETITADGGRIKICANIGNAEEAQEALKNGADGIGLFRSEMLFFEKEEYLDEEEQFLIYKKIAETMQEKKVVIRTLDFGADKQLSFMPSEKECNPALGMRGIRFCLDKKELFEVQLRAIYRASVFGNLSVMYPMVISMEEIEQIKELTEKVKTDLKDSGIPFKEVLQGIMVETPAAVMISDLLSKEVDFFSIGTNDLTQYTLALDRQNPKCEKYYEGVHPAILRMLEMVTKNAHNTGIPVCVCGELAADEVYAKDLIEAGVDELSVAPDRILKVRKTVNDICEGE